jgi:hypothetical protein
VLLLPLLLWLSCSLALILCSTLVTLACWVASLASVPME